MDNVLIELDARRRASLGKLGRHDRYLAREEEDGTIVLAPAVVMSEAEVQAMEERLHRDHPELVQQMKANREDPTKRVARPARPARSRAAEA